MAEAKLVVCPQCGKKYTLKPEFNAASFQCKECAATVPVKREAKVESRKGRTAPHRREAARPARGGRSAATAGRHHGGEEATERGHGRGRGRQQKKMDPKLVFSAIGGLVVLLGIVAFVATRDGKDQPPGKTTATVPAPGTAPSVEPASPAGGEATKPATQPTGSTPETPGVEKPGVEAPAGTEETAPAEDPNKKRLGEEAPPPKSGEKPSRYDPPADLGHLPETTPEEQKTIDSLIQTMVDPDAGRDAFDAKSKLIGIGKKAFPRILGAMAKIRDTITDADTDAERQLESSIKLCDEALREMDGYLESKNVQIIRPGTDKKYIRNILQRHYKRWLEVLSKMDKMPGPYDPSASYEEEATPPGK